MKVQEDPRSERCPIGQRERFFDRSAEVLALIVEEWLDLPSPIISRQ
jgi:hypothetical protein